VLQGKAFENWPAVEHLAEGQHLKALLTLKIRKSVTSLMDTCGQTFNNGMTVLSLKTLLVWNILDRI